jgi:hypothetical protein
VSFEEKCEASKGTRHHHSICVVFAANTLNPQFQEENGVLPPPTGKGRTHAVWKRRKGRDSRNYSILNCP